MLDATLSLEFSARAGVTVLRVLQQQPPFRAIRAFPNSAGEAVVHLHNLSGGVLAGDRLHIDVLVGSAAQAQVTTAGATRLYRRRASGGGSSQSTVLRVGNGALLEYLPDPVIPFGASSYSQKCEVHLGAGAGLIWWEILCAGRIAHGESFVYTDLCSATAIYSPDRPLALERYSLRPAMQAMTAPARMGPFLYSATMYVCRADGSPRWRALEDELSFIACELSGPEALWGVSTLAQDGVVVRGMTRHGHQVSHGLRTLWSAAKQSVWGRAALPPRKVY